jgi:hypothetical protein
MSDTETLKKQADDAMSELRKLSGIMTLVFKAGANRVEPVDLEPQMCQDVAEMFVRLWAIIDHQSMHIERMHGVLDMIDKRVDAEQKSL